MSVPGYICAFQFDSSGRGLTVSEQQIAEVSKISKSWFWLHVNLADWRCRRWLTEVLDLPRDMVSEFAGAPVRQQVNRLHDVLFGHVADFRREFDGDSTEFAWLQFIVGPHYIITGRVKAVQSAERLRFLISAGQRFTSPGELLSRIFSHYADCLDSALHRLTDELEVIEDQVLDERHRGERKRLMVARRETAQLHRHMRAMRRALQTAENAGMPVPDGIASAIGRLSNLDQDFIDLESRARFFHDEIDAKLSAETNRQLYTLSVLTAAFLPPTLVAGLFGMNVEIIPFTGSAWGFWGAVIVSAASAGGVMLYLKISGDQ